MVGLSFSFLATATASDPEAEFAESFDAEDFNTENENMSQDLLAQGQQCSVLFESVTVSSGYQTSRNITPTPPLDASTFSNIVSTHLQQLGVRCDTSNAENQYGTMISTCYSNSAGYRYTYNCSGHPTYTRRNVSCQVFVISQDCQDGEDGNLQCTISNRTAVAAGPLSGNATTFEERVFSHIEDEEFRNECGVTRDNRGLISTIDCSAGDGEQTSWIYACR